MKNLVKQFPSVPKIGDLAGLQLFQLMRFGGNFLLAILLVKLGATTIQIAEFESFIWITGLVTFAWVGGTINTLLSNTNAGLDSSKLLNNIQALMLLQGAFFTILLFLLAPFIQSKNIFLAAIYVLLNPITFVNEYRFLILKQPKKMLVYGALVTALTIAIPTLIYILTGTIENVLWGMLGITFLKLFILFGGLKAFKLDWKIISNLFLISVPITATLFISSGAEYVDGWLVKHFFDESTFAIYRYGARELPLQLILANTLSAAMMLEISKHGAGGISVLKRKSLNLMHFLFPFSLLLLCCSSWLFTMIFDKDYAQSVVVFDVLLLLIIPRLVFPQTILTAKGLNTYQVYAASGELVLNILFSAILVSYIGLPGIAIGTVLAFIFDKSFQIILVRRKLGIPFTDYVSIGPWIIYSAILLLVFGLKYFVV